MGDTPKHLTARERSRARRAKAADVSAGVAEVVELMPADATERRRPRRRVPDSGAQPIRKRSPKTQVEGEDNRPRVWVQLGKRWGQIVSEVKSGKYSWQEFCEGLDPEELARAQLKDRNGTFIGRPPTLVPREFHLQCQRELRRRFEEKMQTRVLEATDEYIKMSRNTKDPKLQEQMLRYIMERVMGPIPKTVEVSTAPKHEGFLAGVIRSGGVVDRRDRYDKRAADIEDEDVEDEG